MTDKRVLKAKPLACEIDHGAKNDDAEGAEHTLADVEKVMRDRSRHLLAVVRCDGQLRGPEALDAIDKHYRRRTRAAKLLDAWLMHALDEEKAGER